MKRTLFSESERRQVMRSLARQTTIPGSDAPATVSQAQRLVQAAELAFARVLEPHATKTQEAYRRAWRAWASWCELSGARVLPIEPAELVKHLEGLSLAGQAPNSVRLALSALASLDRAARVTPADPSPASLRSAVIVQRWLKAWTRDGHPKAPRRQAAAFTARQLREVLQASNEGPAKNQARAAYVVRCARDKALLLLGVYSARRVSELCALELEHVTRTERGLSMRIAQSKTDQEGQGLDVGIMPAGELGVCPVEALNQWLRVRGERPGPLFVEVGRDGQLGENQLTTRSANRIIQGMAKRAGVELVSSHSMRATFITLAVRRRVPLPTIAKHSGHSSMQTLAGYARRASLFDDNPTAGLLDDVT